jgi:hypothetical protein
VTTERPKEFEARTITISYRSIAPRLYWGFVRKATRYGSYLIAEPEKAILDWIYFGIQNGAAPTLDELDFGSVDRPKLLDYARRFPSSTYLHLLPALAESAGGVKPVGAGVGAGDWPRRRMNCCLMQMRSNTRAIFLVLAVLFMIGPGFSFLKYFTISTKTLLHPNPTSYVFRQGVRLPAMWGRPEMQGRAWAE